MPEAQAETLWRGDNPAMLLGTSADAFSSGSAWTLQASGDPNFSWTLFGEHGAPASSETNVSRQPSQFLFDVYHAEVPPLTLHMTAKPIRKAAPRTAFEMGPSFDWRPNPVPLAPDDKDFAGAAIWNLRLPPIHNAPQLADVLLRIGYQGDVARLYSGPSLLDDNFWNGTPWEIGLREVGGLSADSRTLQLQVLPLPKTYPMYIEKADQLHFISGAAGTLSSVELIPRYQLKLDIPSAK